MFRLAIRFHCIKRAFSTQVPSKGLTPYTQALYDGIKEKQRNSLSKAITLVESRHPDHRIQANLLLNAILKLNKNTSSFRIGLSGSPGVGKSTFIEAFGMYLVKQGLRVAVLAVDPSSSRSGGSILGDKTRMIQLAQEDNAYIRPSANNCALGGVARNTQDAIQLCEACGYEVVLVETVGVGQSETIVSEMVDMFVLLVPPAGGDELQGLKRGIVEMVDMILVNKSDGVLETPARLAQIEYTSALKFIQPKSEAWRPEVLRVSAATKMNIDKAWEMMKTYRSAMQQTGELDKMRAQQQLSWMWRHIYEYLSDSIKESPKLKRLVTNLEKQVKDETITPGQAAEEITKHLIQPGE